MNGLLLLIAMAVLLAAASVVAADPATESLWSENNSVSSELTLTSSGNADGATTGTWADANGQWAKNGDWWEFGMEDSAQTGTINSVTLYLKHYQSGWVNDNFLIQIYDGSAWLDVQSYTDGDGPPTSDTTNSWDVDALGIDTWTEINAAKVWIIDNGKTGGADTVDWFVDTVELRVDYTPPNQPPVVETPKTYNSSLVEKTTFEVGEDVAVRTNVTDVNGDFDIDKVLVTIKNPSGTVKVDNATMTNVSPITNGYVYEYNYNTMPIEPASLGTWTIDVYANDTSNAWDSNSATFDVQDTQAPEWSDAQTNKTPVYENDYVKFTANWTDDVALAGYIFSINQTGTWVNSSFVSFSGTPDISENTTQITATAGTTVEWRFYANDTSDNGNATDIRSFVVSSSSPPPPLSSPYMIYGWAFYENGTACDNPVVNITNLNNSKQWQAETNVSYNYYQITLASGTELNVSEILQFDVKAPDGSQSSTTYHTVTQAEINDGGLFDFNITLEAPVTPFVIYGWVNYSNGTACNNPTVNITNTNTSTQWQAETNSSYNYYQLILDTTNISAGDVLEFNATDGTEYNTTTHTVTAGDIDSGGVFDFNLTLPSALPTEGPTVDSITITPDEYGSTPGVQIDPNPGGAKTVTVSAIVSDPDGYGDISTVNITDIDPDPAHGDPSPVTLEYQSGSGNGNTATYNGTFDMQFYDQPVEYTVTVTAKDMGGLSGTDSSTFNYTSCNAMSLDAGTIAFGSIDPGENNTVAGDTNMTTTGSPTVRNTGNVEIDVNITGSNMTSGSDMITKDHINALVGALDYSDLSVAWCFDANMAAGASSLENVDFRLNVPYGTPVGSYNGSVTLTADTCG